MANESAGSCHSLVVEERDVGKGLKLVGLEPFDKVLSVEVEGRLK